VRELRNTIERVINHDPRDVVSASDLPESIRARPRRRPRPRNAATGRTPCASSRKRGTGVPHPEAPRERLEYFQDGRDNRQPRSNLYKKLEQYNIRQDVDS